MAQTFAGDYAEALLTCRTAIASAQEHGERWTHAYSLWVTGVCHWHLGDNAAAKVAATEALQIQEDFQDGICTALTIELLSWVAASTADFKRAQELGHAAEEVWRGLGTTIAAFGPQIEETSRISAERIREELGTGTHPVGQGKRLDLTKKQAINLALDVVVSGKAVEPKNHPLSDREMEIAELISQGLTSRLIAQKLFLSPRTVDGHVERILSKLNYTSRTRIATWVESRRSADSHVHASGVSVTSHIS